MDVYLLICLCRPLCTSDHDDGDDENDDKHQTQNWNDMDSFLSTAMSALPFPLRLVSFRFVLSMLQGTNKQIATVTYSSCSFRHPLVVVVVVVVILERKRHQS